MLFCSKFYFSIPPDVQYDATAPAADVVPLVQPCTTCLAREAAFAFVDCGHMCVCGDCVNQFEILRSLVQTDAKWQNKCPLCTKIIRNAPMRIY